MKHRLFFIVTIILVLIVNIQSARLKITQIGDSAYDPTGVDTTVIKDDTFVLAVYLDNTDTYVNGVQMYLSIPSELSLLDIGGDSFAGATDGDQVWEDHTYFGDVFMNKGSDDTLCYAAITNNDSLPISSDVLLCTMILQANSVGTVTIGFTIDASSNQQTLITDGTYGGNVLTAYDSGIVGISAGPILSVHIDSNIASQTVDTSDSFINVMSVTISGDPGGDTLTKFVLYNVGTADTDDIDSVGLYVDSDNSSNYSAGDVLIASLTSTNEGDTWSVSGLSQSLGTGGESFIVTIDINSSAITNHTFTAQIPAYTLIGSSYGTGPYQAYTNSGTITIDTQANIVIAISEINIYNPEWTELYCVDDGNGGAGTDISGWYISDFESSKFKIVGDTDNDGTIDTPVIIKTGQFLVINDTDATKNDESSAGVDNIINIYDDGYSYADDDGIVIYNSNGVAKQGLIWADRDGTISSSEQTDINDIVTLGMWQSGAYENNCVTPNKGTSWSGLYIARADTGTNTNSKSDWNVNDTSTLGLANIGENPVTTPAVTAITAFYDEPTDNGGVLHVQWDTSLVADFYHYNLYISTQPFAADITQSNIQPEIENLSDSSITDTIVTTIAGSALTNGDSYYVAVTVVDSYGHENLTLADSGPVAPYDNLTGTATIVISEVAFSSGGGGYSEDWIELYVKDVSNLSTGFNMMGWNVVVDGATKIKTFGSLTVFPGDYVLLHFNDTGNTDESDTGGDGIVQTYTTNSGLVGTDENVSLKNDSNNYVDFVGWSNRDNTPTGGEISDAGSDLDLAISAGMWDTGLTQNNCVNPTSSSSFAAGYSITRNSSGDDSNCDTDWMVDPTPTPGSATDLTYSLPASVSITSLEDLQKDQGGQLLLKWTAVTSSSDFDHYNVYISTASFSYIDQLTYRADNSSITDSSTDYLLISTFNAVSLSSSESYFVMITIVDSTGLENVAATISTGATPMDNISGSPKILINEVAMDGGGGGISEDWIELYCADDGNAGSGINLSGWYIKENSTSIKTFGASGEAFIDSGEYLLLQCNSSTTDDTSTAGDSILNSYTSDAGLTATDVAITLYDNSDTIHDFMVYENRASSFTSSAKTKMEAAQAASQWFDPYNPGVGDTVECLNSSFISSGYSFRRFPNGTDSNDTTDWDTASTPTPGSSNDVINTGPWTVSGTLDLEGRASEQGCSVILTNGTDTYMTTSDASGAWSISNVDSGTGFTLYADTVGYLLKVAYSSSLDVTTNKTGISIGTLKAGDANDDNKINMLDASIVKIAISTGNNDSRADLVDSVGTIDVSDLAIVRTNFGAIGENP